MELTLSGDAVRDRLALFERAVERVRSGEWTVEAFGGWLEEVARQMSDRERALQEIYSSLPPELEEVFLEEAEIGFRGIALYQKGISTMRDFVDRGDMALLAQALDAMRSGNGLINEAMRINRTNRETDEETTLVDDPSD